MKEIEYIVTEGDLQVNPELATNGISIGDKIIISEGEVIEGSRTFVTTFEGITMKNLLLEADELEGSNFDEKDESANGSVNDEDEFNEEDFEGVEYVDVVKGGRVVRRYSSKDHGENFIELAKGYAKKIGADMK